MNYEVSSAKHDGVRILPPIVPIDNDSSRRDTPERVGITKGSGESGAPGDEVRILVIDDDPGLQCFVARALAIEGIVCDVADGGVSGLELASTRAYDLILLDIELPDLRGDAVLRAVRSSPQSPYQKVIVYSGGWTPDQLAGLLQAGADDYLVKPFSIEQLLARVKASLRLKAAQTRSDLLHRQLERAYADLESRVQERTCELTAANEALREEIRERKRAEDTCRRVSIENDRLLAAITSILIAIDDAGRISAWNAAAEAAFGIPRGEACGRRLSDLPIRWAEEGFLTRLERSLGTHEEVRLDDVAVIRADGSRLYLGFSVTPVPADEATPRGSLVTGADVTERRVLASQLIQAQKLESIGQLAAGIAHEINTPIQYIGDNTRFLGDSFGALPPLVAGYRQLLAALKGGSAPVELMAEVERLAAEIDVEFLAREIPRAIEQTLEGVARVAKIVQAMKEFSHPGSDEKTAVDLNHAIESTLTIARNEWKYVADVVAHLDPDLPPVPCLPGELNQVMLNLFVNAAHAIAECSPSGPSGKGTITVRTRPGPGFAEIEISDTGCGIPEAIRPRVFDPFFTTKPVGKGTGQGLAISHNVIVKKHGGTIDFRSEVGKGTTFTIRLPLDAAGPA